MARPIMQRTKLNTPMVVRPFLLTLARNSLNETYSASKY